MTFGQSIKSVFANLTNFQGRARRSEFWWFYLFIGLVSIPISVVFAVIVVATLPPVRSGVDANGLGIDDPGRVLGVLAVIFGLGLLLGLVTYGLTLAVWVRRLHDVGQSGHWLWLALAGLSIVPLVMVIADGEPRDNRYGPDPKAAERGAAGGWTQPPSQGHVPPMPPAPPS